MKFSFFAYKTALYSMEIWEWMSLNLVYQNQNAKNIGNFTTLLKPHNIGTHLKGIETSFQVVPLFLKSFHFWVSYIAH
jgi:hypothetical protein